jgi:hypothetical protein
MRDKTTTLTSEDALVRIAAIWVLWSRHEITETEALARIAEALEVAGIPVIEDPG